MQRLALLRVATAYRTVSTKALQVITGIPPIDVLVKERGRLHKFGEGHLRSRRKEERERTLEEWQARWQEEGDVGQWTKRLIPDIKKWHKCAWRALGYYLTQLRTGHGSFESYRRRIGKVPDGGCRNCSGHTEDTPEHTVMRCPRWIPDREELWRITGNTRQIEEIIQTMVKDKESWGGIAAIISRIMKTKEEEERIQ